MGITKFSLGLVLNLGIKLAFFHFFLKLTYVAGEQISEIKIKALLGSSPLKINIERH